MEVFSSVTYYSLVAAFLSILLLKWITKKKRSSSQKPPGPPAWPLVGNIFHLGSMPHQNLYKLRPKYGPVIWLKLGSLNTLVVQSAKSAANMFKHHDLAFADRTVPDAMTACGYNQGSLAFGSYGPHWRSIRKLCTMELLVSNRVDHSTEIREKCVEKMVSWIEEGVVNSQAQGRSGEVELCHLLFVMAFNLVGNLMLSRDLLDLQSKEGREFYNAMDKFMALAGTPNIADFMPFLKWLDPLRIKKDMVKATEKAISIATSFVKERIQGNVLNTNKAVKRDFLDVLLEYEGDGKEGPDKFSEHNITIMILEMFLAGSETTSSTIEWAMAELLRSPESMRKVKEELDSVLARSKKMKESDIEKLPYLQAVVKETLRLHPSIPLLIPRNSVEDTNYMGYLIPKGTQVLVNAWAIGRDPDAWEEPLSFKPERFLGSNIDYKGQHFEFIPFGSGRRICAGMVLGLRVIHLTLATLLWNFDWELDCSVTPQTMDMQERMGVTLRKLIPLKSIPKKRNE